MERRFCSVLVGLDGGLRLNRLHRVVQGGAHNQNLLHFYQYLCEKYASHGLISRAMSRCELPLTLITVLQWGPLKFHEKSLQNLQAAMKISHRLCAIMLDTAGREICVRRPFKIGEDGWPYHDHPISIKEGQKVCICPPNPPPATLVSLQFVLSIFNHVVHSIDTILSIGRSVGDAAESMQ